VWHGAGISDRLPLILRPRNVAKPATRRRTALHLEEVRLVYSRTAPARISSAERKAPAARCAELRALQRLELETANSRASELEGLASSRGLPEPSDRHGLGAHDARQLRIASDRLDLPTAEKSAPTATTAGPLRESALGCLDSLSQS
jgi:hypothetical protein